MMSQARAPPHSTWDTELFLPAAHCAARQVRAGLETIHGSETDHSNEMPSQLPKRKQLHLLKGVAKGKKNMIQHKS